MQRCTRLLLITPHPSKPKRLPGRPRHISPPWEPASQLDELLLFGPQRPFQPQMTNVPLKRVHTESEWACRRHECACRAPLSCLTFLSHCSRISMLSYSLVALQVSLSRVRRSLADCFFVYITLACCRVPSLPLLRLLALASPCGLPPSPLVVRLGPTRCPRLIPPLSSVDFASCVPLIISNIISCMTTLKSAHPSSVQFTFLGQRISLSHP